ncbi:MAG: hypothetical protein NVSMB57_06280 [Actinomycetota bacterium]
MTLAIRRSALIVILLVLSTGSFARAAEPYRQETFDAWNHSTLSIVIAPPAHGQIYNDAGVLPAGPSELTPQQSSYIAAAERGIRSWMGAMRTLGPDWLANVKLKTAVIGRDALPSGPDILLVFDETMGPILGTSYNSRPCVAVVAMEYHVSFTTNDVQNLAAHEVGHCLGLTHVDEPGPAADLMQAVYQHPDGLRSTGIMCPSNLNVSALERSFATALGHPTPPGLAAIDPADYRVSCG